MRRGLKANMSQYVAMEDEAYMDTEFRISLQGAG